MALFNKWRPLEKTTVNQISELYSLVPMGTSTNTTPAPNAGEEFHKVSGKIVTAKEQRVCYEIVSQDCQEIFP